MNKSQRPLVVPSVIIALATVCACQAPALSTSVAPSVTHQKTTSAVPHSRNQTRTAIGQESILHAFTGTGGDGAWAATGLFAGSKRQLYGTTILGGSANGGTAFEFIPPTAGRQSWSQAILHTFGNVNDGARPDGSLIADAKGRLYGTTLEGGASGSGIVFELIPPVSGQGSWTETILHSFTNANGDGNNPVGSLFMDLNGALYGSTASGGAGGNCSPGGCGIVYKLSPPSHGQTAWKETILHAFTGTSGDGALPLGGLIEDSYGNLYGMTNGGGGNNNGTVFELTPPPPHISHWTETVLYEFTGVNGDGRTPEAANLLRDLSGALYGTTSGGGVGYGTVFKLSPPNAGQNSWTEAILYAFTNVNGDGASPEVGLTADSSGSLYGTTGYGGGSANCSLSMSGGCGTVYKLTPPLLGQVMWDETILHDFTGANENGDGEYPQGSVILDAQGNLYGTTAFGGRGGLAFLNGETRTLCDDLAVMPPARSAS